MANKSVTTEVAFDEIPVLNDRMFSVRSGIDADVAIRKADALYESVTSLLAEGVQDGVPAETAYLCEFAMDCAFALRLAAGAVA
jgi:hypothetical protein